MKRYAFIMLCALVSLMAQASVTIQKVSGWFESGYVTWTPVTGQTYKVYVRPEGGTYTQLDNELVRNYGSYGRADMVGLKAGNYQFKVVASNGDEAETSVFTAVAHDRNGFAHMGWNDGIGAYKNDGTLKDNARVIYLTANNAKTVKCMVKGDKEVEYTGIQHIIAAYEKGKETRPLDVRIVGTVKKADLDSIGSKEEGLQVKGKSGTIAMNITIEGIGNDATVHGFGFLVKKACSVELRNFGIMICMDDCISIDGDNHHCWIHNMDFFYGNTGGDADQAKGDGTVDIKGQSSHVTVSYNHFFDSGKCSLGGMKSETKDCWMTYHHNWFDHSDSRHPRIRTAFYHVYNNYFDGNSKYGVGVTMGGSSFAESNYFRNCKYPFLISNQGTDAEGDGTFSGETGGVIKVYNNVIMNPKQVLYYDGKQTDGAWDVVKVDARETEITATALSGGTSYNNAATAEAIKAVPSSAIDDPTQIPTIVRGDLGAGRMNHGDFKWTFNNATQDENYGVIADLKTALVNYKSTLVAYGDGTAAKNADATETVAGGDAPEEIDFEEEPYITNADGTDYYWVGDNNVDNTKTLISSGKITLANSQAKDSKTGKVYTSKFDDTYTGNDTYKSEHTGSLQLGQASDKGKYDGGAATFYCPNGVTTFKVSMLRTGSCYCTVEKSTDGVNFTKVAEVNNGATGILTKDFSTSVRNLESKDPVWIRIVNGSTGGLNIFGILINQLATKTYTITDLASVISYLNNPTTSGIKKEDVDIDNSGTVDTTDIQTLVNKLLEKK